MFLCYLTLDFRIILTINIGFFYIVTKLFYSISYFFPSFDCELVNCVKCSTTYFVICQICGWSDSSQQEVWVWKNAMENFSRKHFSQTSRHWQPDWGSTISEYKFATNISYPYRVLQNHPDPPPTITLTFKRRISKRHLVYVVWVV